MMEVIIKAERELNLRIPIYPDEILKTAESCLRIINNVSLAHNKQIDIN